MGKVKSVKIVLVGGSNRGIGDYIKENIIKMGSSKEGLDVKKLDEMCLKKFGIGKGVSESRIKSIRYYLSELKREGKISI